MIRLIDVNLSFDEDEDILKDISFNLPSRGFVFLSGPSGSGKTSLCNLLSGLEKISHGNMLIEDKDLSTFSDFKMAACRNGMISYITQDAYFINELNVLDNILLSVKLQKSVVNPLIHKQIKDLFKYFNLPISLLKKKPFKLSGGQLQRANIIRSLIKDVDVIIADEPTGNLDPDSSNLVFKKLKEISEKKLVIVVTHDVLSATKNADIIIKLKEGIVKDYLIRKQNGTFDNGNIQSNENDLDLLTYVDNLEKQRFISKIQEVSNLFENDHLLQFKSVSSNLPFKEVHSICKSFYKTHWKRNLFSLFNNFLSSLLLFSLMIFLNSFLGKIFWYKQSFFKNIYLEFKEMIILPFSKGFYLLSFVGFLVIFLFWLFYFLLAKSFLNRQTIYFYRAAGITRILGANSRIVNKIIFYFTAYFILAFTFLHQMFMVLYQGALNKIAHNGFHYFSIFLDKKEIPGFDDMNLFQQKISLLQLSLQRYPFPNDYVHNFFAPLCENGFFSISPSYRTIVSFVGFFIICFFFVYSIYLLMNSKRLNKTKPLMMLKKGNS
ncbi:MAG: ABC transporter ATP-binding protein [Pigeon pea little leaf phytoplasma]|uniref:ABC transporter ATP-binding protein n=1 Tax=Candidatus Phytoplasma fabacearum TaxID=2982628 RepID=A0ABU8ZSZ2_9MOLU|nr:ABC transporter ATP-binding protein ['Bituminaria bituminosa' little leaf phytoplasma]MDV3148857.1 ABC transporter ATP-binding protein [Pigeon pea little leaf phytoplasma]MDO7983737.1 ABC transporter ATP-binding protein ['Bituminaria bituminosa' little leaf phytoplasma]MDO8024109.1 ABC transporter ATP-binding protein ['Bituminaria bituminosa' little leaf phytoplasma]MDV3158817.1 ABC transporter ATP-binding protein [Pigeon pea little leaf phytoplasma]MDV3161689.1 ABC transporter ATP-binding 